MPTNPLVPAFLPAIDTNPAHYASNIWITDTMQKVRQDSGSPGSNYWGTFYGTQNEFVDFQVHFQDSGSGTANLSVTVSDFVQTSPGSFTISAASTNIIVYREAYIHVQTYPSNNQLDSAVPGGANQNTYYSGGPLGFYPDVLIPAKDPYWGQTTNAWPITVAASKNQSAWVDVLIPSNAPSGYYLGSVTVKSGNTTLSTMPVIIAVWQWPSASNMPSTTTLKTLLENWNYDSLCTQMYAPSHVGGGFCGSYPGSGGGSDGGNTMLFLDASMLVRDHRFNSGGLQNIYPQSGSFSTWVTYYTPLMNGTCVPHAGGATTCPLLSGALNTTKTLDYLGSASSGIWNNWQSNFISNGWGTAGTLPLFDALCDEPFPGGGGACGAASQAQAFPTIVANAATRHAFSTPGVPEMVTTDIFWGNNTQAAADTFSISTCGSKTCIGNSIDILVPTISTLEPIGFPAQPLSAYTMWLSGTTDGIPRQWWSYLACTTAGTCTNTRPGPAPYGSAYTTWPNYSVDGKPAANRAMEWLTFKHGQTGELYYSADVCSFPTVNNMNKCVPSGVAADYDPWNGIYYSGGWGDGTLVYAGGVVSNKVNYMGASVTVPIVLPSIRLKHMRDGVQDYEYLNVLTTNGKSGVATAQLNSWVTNSYTFETSGTGLQAARTVLGNTIHSLTFPDGPATVTAGVGSIFA